MKKAPAPTKAQGAFKDNGRDFLTVRRIVKAALLVAAQRGWLPVVVAEWLIQHGGLAHA